MSSVGNTQGKATIFDVAELAGVSIKTVSRVVNNEPNVRQKTRDKVNEAVKKLDYRPNAAARGLSAKRSFAIGLVYENPDEFSYIHAVLNGALAACEREGYSLLIKPLILTEGDVAASVRDFVSQARLDGLILTSPIGDFDEVINYLKDQELPYASITPKKPAPGAITIDCEDETASFELTEYLIAQGHRRIAFIKGHPDHWASDERFKGYRRALQSNQIPFTSELVAQGYFDFESGRDCAARLLALDEPPSVIVASNDAMASGALFEAREEGIDVPGELSITGFDDTTVASQMWPPLTTVRQPIAEMADSAVRRLIQKFRGDDKDAVETHFKCELMIRGSTKTLMV